MAGKAFGEQNPNQGETAVSWATWSDGGGGSPTISGDPDWGKLSLTLDPPSEGRSAVYDLGNTVTRVFTLTSNRYGSGGGTANLEIRGNTTSFSQDDSTPAWEEYTSPISRGWRYVQVRENTADNLLLSVSPNSRYLVNENGTPFLIKGDSAHGLFFNISTAAAATYLASRSAAGVNAIWVQLLPSTYSNISTGWKTYDNIAPFSWDGSDPTTFDLSAPNETYFARIDAMMDLCLQYGIVAFLDPTETGGWLDTFKANSQANRRSYGTYVGNRYKGYPNIVWQHGNDFQTWSTAGDDNAVLDIVRYLAAADTNHIATVEFDFESSDSGVDNRWTPGTDWQLNSAYSYLPQYDRMLTAYGRSGPHPAYFIEGVYENQTYEGGYSGPHELRAQEYWVALSGACGQLWGSATLYPFASGWNNSGWDTTQGFLEYKIHYNFFLSYNWYSLVPDSAHTFLTSGYGTYATTGTGNTSNYCTCASISNTLAITYMPVASTMTFDMTQFGGTVTARWFDPTDGSYATDAASPLANSGTHNFSRAGTNSAGDHDWVLVLNT